MHGRFNQSFSLSVKNGHGQEQSPKKLTGFVNISGTMTITAPDTGAWHLMVKDLVKNKPILDQKNVKAGTAIELRYKTGMHTQIQVEATWDQTADTTLVVEINATY